MKEMAASEGRQRVGKGPCVQGYWSVVDLGLVKLHGTSASLMAA